MNIPDSLPDTDIDKWDNHNAIARGWRTVKDSYHPVTFRKLYGVDKQSSPVFAKASSNPN